MRWGVQLRERGGSRLNLSYRSLQMDAHREEQLAQDSQAEARPSGGAETLRTSVLGYMVWPDWEDSTTMIVGDPIPMTPVAPEAYPALGAEERRFVLAQITFITGDGVSVAAGEGFYWWGNLMVALEGLGSLPFRRRKLGLEGQAALRHELRGYARARDFPPEAPAAKELVRRREQAGSAKLGWDSLDVYEWVSAQHALHLGWKFSVSGFFESWAKEELYSTF